MATPDSHSSGMQLEFNNDVLYLHDSTDPAAGRLSVDFNSAELTYRRKRPLGAEFLVKAVGGLRPRHRPKGDIGEGHVIDATAGLGQDAFILAAAGWQVTLIEQSPVVHALLEDGLRRASQADDAELRQIIARMHLSSPADAVQELARLPQAEVIYLDPMFPERKKSARVKKNRFLLQKLHGDRGQGEGLLEAALALAAKIVVKRPAGAPPLALNPTAEVHGKTSRFDIYVGTGPSSKRSMMSS